MREAVINLSDDALEQMGFGELISECRAAGIREVELLEDNGRGGIAQLTLKQELDEEKLDTLDCVDHWELVTENDNSFLYILEVTAINMPEQATTDHDSILGVCDTTVGDRGLLLSLVGSQETIRDMIRNFEAAGVVPDLHRLGEYDGGKRMLDVLTDRQLETLQTAYDMGFYDVPKQTSVDEIASEIGVDASTASEHLQRAERNLLTQQFTSQN